MRTCAGSRHLGEHVDPCALALRNECCGIMPPLRIIEITDQQTTPVALKHRIKSGMKFAPTRLRSASKVPLNGSFLKRQIVRSGLGSGVKAAAYRGAPTRLSRAGAGPSHRVDIIPTNEARAEQIELFGTRRCRRHRRRQTSTGRQNRQNLP